MRAAVFALLAACSGDDTPPPDPPPDNGWPGGVAWAWTFSDGGPCPDGVTNVNVYRAGYDPTPFVYRLEPVIMTTAACSAGGAGFALENPLGALGYGNDTWIELVTSDGRVFAKSHVVNTKTKNATPSAVIEVPRGWVHVAWTLFGEATQMPLTCDDVPSLRTGTGDGAVLLYESIETDIVLAPTDTSCAEGQAKTMWLGLPAGTHDLSLGAFSSLEFVLNDPNNSMRLGKITFAGQTITPGATLELGTQRIGLVDY